MATKCGKLIRKTIVYDAELKGRISCLGGMGSYFRNVRYKWSKFGTIVHLCSKTWANKLFKNDICNFNFF